MQSLSAPACRRALFRRHNAVLRESPGDARYENRETVHRAISRTCHSGSAGVVNGTSEKYCKYRIDTDTF